MANEMRVLRPDEWDAWYSHLELAFGGQAESPEERELWRALIEPERALGVWDGPACTASAAAFSFRLTVPGGPLVPAAGVTCVGVAPTHRRRGLLTSLMRRQLDDVRAGDEPIAVLTASEPGIYGRFGYGIASHGLSVDVDTARVRLEVPPGTDEVRLRLADPEQSLAACEKVYAELVPARPGMTARQPGWERLPVLDPPGDRSGRSALLCVLAEGAGGGLRGYARYRIRPRWEQGSPAGQVEVQDLDALDPAAYAALWRYVCGTDLVSSVQAYGRPVDDPLLHLVSDARRVRARAKDALHLRLVDLPAALRARAYDSPVDVVLDVSDPFCPWNEGRWRLAADGRGEVVCEPSREPADVALSVRELGAAYLGGTTLASLAGSGRVTELRAGALTEVSRAFRGELAPWLPHRF
ncbi:GNAT family N-acetyltransferase [Streptomyces antimicrobicus]|uniref:GNAT family N-acetyltransferase n=1 Tax=Streptomyces antimicrobicus TaxID=2883108 RepID=A0ABS8B3F9_9ACTN|nr:GNAT family N-acetyltransferase [Streptomyces antimicrobicus]MCB5179149.1 GNAT family N-acetyltransferase [Streptomyces antimicrobicus]